MCLGYFHSTGQVLQGWIPWTIYLVLFIPVVLIALCLNKSFEVDGYLTELLAHVENSEITDLFAHKDFKGPPKVLQCSGFGLPASFPAES